MKTPMKIALALALVTGVSAAALTLDGASARGWGNGGEQGQFFKGPRGGHGPMKLFAQFDVNKDQALTKDEITTGIAKKIADNDKDGDGAVSLEEFKAEWAKMTQELMVRAYQRMDRDGNGKVTTQELTEQASFMFDRMDRNDDGKIDKSDRPNKRMGKRGDGQRGEGRFHQGQAPWSPKGASEQAPQS